MSATTSNGTRPQMNHHFSKNYGRGGGGNDVGVRGGVRGGGAFSEDAFEELSRHPSRRTALSSTNEPSQQPFDEPEAPRSKSPKKASGAHRGPSSSSSTTNAASDHHPSSQALGSQQPPPLHEQAAMTNNMRLGKMLRDCANYVERGEFHPILYQTMNALHVYTGESRKVGGGTDSNTVPEPSNPTSSSSSNNHAIEDNKEQPLAAALSGIQLNFNTIGKKLWGGGGTRDDVSVSGTDYDERSQTNQNQQNNVGNNEEWCEKCFVMGCQKKNCQSDSGAPVTDSQKLSQKQYQQQPSPSSSVRPAPTNPNHHRPSFQRPVHPQHSSNLIANGWIEQQRRSKMRVVWKEVLASLVGGGGTTSSGGVVETTLWIQRQVTPTELEALHQIPLKWMEECAYQEAFGDHRFSLKVYNVAEDFHFRCRDAESAQNWVVTLRSARDAFLESAAASGTSPPSVPSGGGGGGGHANTENVPINQANESTHSEGSSGSVGSAPIKMSVKELKAIAHGAGIDTHGMEKADLERIAMRVMSLRNNHHPPPKKIQINHQNHSNNLPDTTMPSDDPKREQSDESRIAEEGVEVTDYQLDSEGDHYQDDNVSRADEDRRMREEERRRQMEEAAARSRLRQHQEERRRQQEQQQQQAEEAARMREEALARERLAEASRMRQQKEEAMRRQQQEEQARIHRQQQEEHARMRQQQQQQEAAARLRKQQQEEAERKEREATEARNNAERIRKQQEQQWWQQQQWQQQQQQQHYYNQQQHYQNQQPPPPSMNQQQQTSQYSQQRQPIFNNFQSRGGIPSPTNQFPQQQPPPPPHQQPPFPPGSGPTASSKYVAAMNTNDQEEAEQAAMTELKRHVLINWALQPPTFNTLRPIEHLVSTIQHVYPPAFGVAGHSYFGKWKSPDLGSNDDEKLKKAVRKIRFFLHPDKLPKDLDEQQKFMCKMLWDITNDAWEERVKRSEELDWVKS